MFGTYEDPIKFRNINFCPATIFISVDVQWIVDEKFSFETFPNIRSVTNNSCKNVKAALDISSAIWQLVGKTFSILYLNFLFCLKI